MFNTCKLENQILPKIKSDQKRRSKRVQNKQPPLEDSTITDVGAKINEQLYQLEETCKILRAGKLADRIFDGEGSIDLHLEEWEKIAEETCPDVLPILKIMITSFSGSGIFIVIYIILV